MGLTLLGAAGREYLTPLEDFGSTSHVYHRTYVTDTNVYLLVAAHTVDEGDLVYGVGWACNEYWAVQVWGFNGNAFRNEFDPTVPRAAAPSLESVGLPNPLTYVDVLETARRDGLQMPVSVGYHMTDGSFESHKVEVKRKQRWIFHYADPNPEPSDEPAAIEIHLGGRRWERHLAEIQRANEGLNPSPLRRLRWRHRRT